MQAREKGTAIVTFHAEQASRMLDVTVTIGDSRITSVLLRTKCTKFNPEFAPARAYSIRQAFSASQCYGLAPGFHAGIVTISNVTAASRAPTTTACEITSIAVSLTVLPPKQLEVDLPLVRR